MKLLDDPEIPTARRSPQEPHNTRKFLDITTEMRLKPGDAITTTWAPPHLTLTLKPGE
jgi:hypothetical protein